ncbi:MAG: hypothetical protein WDA27_08695 [Actinomycetota bacterium]
MEPKDFARVVLRRKKTVITAIVIVMVTAFFGSMRSTPQYVAACEVLFQAVNSDPTNPNSKPVETVGDLNSNVHFLAGPEIAAAAAKKLGIPAQAVQGKINATIQPNTQFFSIKVATTPPAPGEKSYDPAVRAGAICNAVGEAYIDFKKEAARHFYAQLLEQNNAAQVDTRKEYISVQARLDAAREGTDQGRIIEMQIRRDQLASTIGDLQRTATGLQNALVSGIEDGGKLTSPSAGGVRVGSDQRRTLLLGLIVGLMFGIGIALVREYLDDTMRDKESTQRELGLPVLAALPAQQDYDGFGESSGATVEAARTLRATLASMGVPQDKSVLLITSTMAKRRSSTLVSLAGAFAESGRSVLVIGSDLRGARTHEAFGIANSVGLANVVRGQVPLERAVRPAPGMDGVFVLPCGPMIGNPGELLSSEEMAFTLRRARRWADVVLLDSPPVLAAADASILGAYADGVLLVVSAGQTNRAHANEAKEQLAAAGARVLGAVLVGSEDMIGRAPGDGYGEDLPSMMPYGTWGGAYDAGAHENWYTEEVLTATAYTSPRTRSASSRPAKKVSAARPGTAPARPRAQAATKRAPKPTSRVGAGSKAKPAARVAGTKAKASTSTRSTRSGTATNGSGSARARAGGSRARAAGPAGSKAGTRRSR